IGNGDGPDTANCGIQLAEKFDGKPEYPRIWASVGLHPHEASLANQAADSQMLRLPWDAALIAAFGNQRPGSRGLLHGDEVLRWPRFLDTRAFRRIFQPTESRSWRCRVRRRCRL